MASGQIGPGTTTSRDSGMVDGSAEDASAASAAFLARTGRKPVPEYESRAAERNQRPPTPSRSKARPADESAAGVRSHPGEEMQPLSQGRRHVHGPEDGREAVYQPKARNPTGVYGDGSDPVVQANVAVAPPRHPNGAHGPPDGMTQPDMDMRIVTPRSTPPGSVMRNPITGEMNAEYSGYGTGKPRSPSRRHVAHPKDHDGVFNYEYAEPGNRVNAPAPKVAVANLEYAETLATSRRDAARRMNQSSITLADSIYDKPGVALTPAEIRPSSRQSAARTTWGGPI